MRIALYTTATREPSFTHRQAPPESFRWTARYDYEADLVLATSEVANWLLAERSEDETPKILWLQESRWLTKFEPSQLRDFDLVLSNDEAIVAKGPRYMTLFGTWITCWDEPVKTKAVSMIASRKDHPAAEGYRIRREVRGLLASRPGSGVDTFGGLFHRVISDKWDALAPYRFSIAIESERYNWWHTEKLFDCFATKTIPLYWGCQDPSKLIEWGFDPAGILWWSDPAQLAGMLRMLTEEFYRSMLPAIERNYARVRELYCVEVVLEEVLRNALLLDSRNGVQRRAVDR